MLKIVYNLFVDKSVQNRSLKVKTNADCIYDDDVNCCLFVRACVYNRNVSDNFRISTSTHATTADRIHIIIEYSNSAVNIENIISERRHDTPCFIRANRSRTSGGVICLCEKLLLTLYIYLVSSYDYRTEWERSTQGHLLTATILIEGYRLLKYPIMFS